MRRRPIALGNRGEVEVHRFVEVDSEGRGWRVLHLGQESDSSGCASLQLGHDLRGVAEVLYDSRGETVGMVHFSDGKVACG